MDEKIRLVEYEGEKGWSRHIALLRRVSVLLSPFVVIFISLKDDVAAFEFGLLKTRRADIGATNEACISHAGSFLNGGINFHPLIQHTCSITRRFGRELEGARPCSRYPSFRVTPVPYAIHVEGGNS